jgi:hypothetical protein
MTLVNSVPQVIATNNNWQEAPNAATIQAMGLNPANNLESAILVTLNPGAYTVIVSGVNNGTGIGIVSVVEVDTPAAPMINISTRGQVLTGEGVMIGGFIISGHAPQTVVVRARGPSLGMANTLQDPVLVLVRQSDGAVIAVNDNWGQAPNAAEIQASGFAPSALESAVLMTLEPGAYTAIVYGQNNGTGIGIVEVFSR